MINGNLLLTRALTGATDLPVAAAPLYPSLYWAAEHRRRLVEVYRERAGATGELHLTLAEDLEIRVEALCRTWRSVSDPPAWGWIGLGPARAHVEGARVVCEPDRCLWYAPGRDEPHDLLAKPTPTVGEWDRRDAPTTVEEVRDRLPLHRAEEWLDDGQDLLPRLLAERLGREFCLVGALGSPFWASYGVFGFTGLMQNLRGHPELLLEVAHRSLHNSLEHARALWQAGLRVIFIEECLSGSDLISPEDYRHFAWPFLRDLLAGLKQMGFLVIHYHCGGIEGRLEMLAECAADALAFEESKKGFVIDLARVRREIGPERVLLGNTDVVLLRDGTEEEITADQQRQYAEAGPRFIVSTGSPLTLDTHPEKISMLTRAARTLRG